ncbi:membrane protein FxsA [Omnitrophica bacterium]|nr:membrane protein FxsA [Candidatus Omnitrophota bacterium]
MFQILVLLFIFVPLAELAVLIEVGRSIGVTSTILIVIFTGVLGAYLARTQGLMILTKISRELNQGQMPSDALFDGLMILAGGILLLTPGLITDSMGFFLLIPQGRNLIKRLIQKKIEEQFRSGRTIHIRYFDRTDL